MKKTLKTLLAILTCSLPLIPAIAEEGDEQAPQATEEQSLQEQLQSAILGGESDVEIQAILDNIIASEGENAQVVIQAVVDAVTVKNPLAADTFIKSFASTLKKSGLTITMPSAEGGEQQGGEQQGGEQQGGEQQGTIIAPKNLNRQTIDAATASPK